MDELNNEIEPVVEQPVAPKKKTKVEPKLSEQDKKIIDLVNAGFNVNQIGSMMGVHTHIVREVIERENAKL
jgi:uncharacterized Fe-S cluster-containing radical SAM superfamily protein